MVTTPVRSLIGVLALTLTVGGCTDVTDPVTPKAIPQVGLELRLPANVVNRYIVVLKRSGPRATATAGVLSSTLGGTVFALWETAIKGFAIANLPTGALDAIRKHPLVDYVEEDKQATPVTIPSPQTFPANGTRWGLDRIDTHISAKTGQPYAGSYNFYYTGAGVHVYIIDSGVRGGHQEWNNPNRIGNGATFLHFSNDPSATVDQSGHGTQVAGVAAGTTFGVAKDATIHPVRVNDNASSWTSDVVSGLDWVAAHAIHPAVANLSIVNDASSVSGAMDGVIASGVVMVIAAGDGGSDHVGDEACGANKELHNAYAIVVSSSTPSDDRAGFADFGPCVDIFAPGQGIMTADKDSNSDSTDASGNSVAAPFVTGVAALILQQDPLVTPAWVKWVIEESATPFNPSNIGSGSPQRLLYALHNFAMIYGVGSVTTSTTTQTGETWTARTYGGNGTWSFVWEAAVNSGGWSTVGTSRSYTRTFAANDSYDLELRLTATSNGETKVKTIQVPVRPPSPPPECPPPNDQCLP